MATGTGHGIERRERFRRLAPWMIAALVLLLPLAAMRFTDEVDWDAADFAIMGALLLSVCGSYEAAARTTGDFAYRAAIAVALVAGFLLVWINLAVGIIGSEGDPANLIFAAVLAVAILGALAARLRPRGMARALAATALAQILACAVVLIAGWGFAGANGPWPLVALTGFFTALWLGSAWLFLRAEK
jgi:hypothetical protein